MELSHQAWVRVIFALIGLFGVAFAVSGVFISLPVPAAGGTCGPGTSSEAPISALFDPVSIGAGPEPGTDQPAERQNWMEFVHDCQTSADSRGLASLAILAVSLVVAIGGPMVVLRRKKRGPGPIALPAAPVARPASPVPDWRL